ncbi:Gibberellin 2-beta-dioxygenase 8 [Hordeum vulgare]|nr:Gibberellin 2-beta-dioxygenase 8 [Hordeum vulgare]
MLTASPPFVVMDNEGQDSPLSCEQVEAHESIVSVAPVADDVEAVGMLAPDPLEPSQPLAFVNRGLSTVLVTHSNVILGQVCVRDKVNEILFEILIHSLLACLERASDGSRKTTVEEALRSKSKKSSITKRNHQLLDG